jgi:hypothetical protein
MSPKKQPDDRPRREKENMDKPQEEFIDISSIPSHTKGEQPKGETTQKSDKKKA